MNKHFQKITNQIISTFVIEKMNFGYQIFLIGQDFHYLDLNKLQIINQPKTSKSNDERINKTMVSYQIFSIQVSIKY